MEYIVIAVAILGYILSHRKPKAVVFEEIQLSRAQRLVEAVYFFQQELNSIGHTNDPMLINRKKLCRLKIKEAKAELCLLREDFGQCGEIK